MVSIQRWLVKNNQCLELLEASAKQARLSVGSLVALVNASPDKRSLDAFAHCRAAHKKITKDLIEHLCVTFVTPMEREDIETMGTVLNRVSKATEKFAERYVLAPQHVAGWDLRPQMDMLQSASVVLEEIVSELCNEARMERVRELNTNLQTIESDADLLLEKSLQHFYSADEGSVRCLVQKDLTEQLEKVFDRCRSVGNTAYWTLLKNS
jgi:uncharacterized protein Yka (UPF0111/DUF47 family)